MVKISLAELQQVLDLAKKTSTDVHCLVVEDHEQLRIQFQSVDGPMVSISLYDEAQRSFAKVTTTENLQHVLKRK